MFPKLLLAVAALAATALSAQFQSSTVPGVFWTVKNLARDCTPPTLPTPSCSYEMIISATNDEPDFDCRLTDYGSPVSAQNTTLTDPRYNTFGGYYCNGDNAHSGGWQISWGYNNNTGHDSAVMTVLNQPLNQDAWFGWNYVNNRTQFEDVGPNPVYTIGTFT
ncbi:hypothetical protein N431DRAFT_503296 [Stipitochalara longipes BDJ]|nr:hypothetical protein N431DRAFT_503296 [Stipitochalara longipes BDJ]